MFNKKKSLSEGTGKARRKISQRTIDEAAEMTVKETGPTRMEKLLGATLDHTVCLTHPVE